MDPSALIEKESMVDPFLVEALQNPRHRLTILRMELEIRRFLQSPDQNHFEFQQLPTSYLRLAAHRVAQHYGLQTMVRDNGLDGSGNRILAIKTTESKFPAVRLSDISAKQLEGDKSEQIKIVLRPQPGKSSPGDANGAGIRSVRSMEERKEEYDKARARIFGGDETLSDTTESSRVLSSTREENEAYRNVAIELETRIGKKDAGTSRVAILRDREKDCSDPDYDRSYERYARNIPFGQNFGLMPYNVQEIPYPFGHLDTRFAQLGQMPRAAPGSLNYMPPPSSAVMTSFCATGPSQTASDVGYVQWPTAVMIYAHSYDQFRHGVFQAPMCQQPLSFDYSQNRR